MVNQSEHRGTAKDSETEGRSKENREAGTTPGREARTHEPAKSGHSAGGSDNPKSREHRDSDGEVHHHTRTYVDQRQKKK